MTIKVRHSFELTVDKDCNVGELKKVLDDYAVPDNANIGVVIEKADRPYNSDSYYVRVTW